MSIGYEIGVTPLQIAGAFATIANDGIRNQPHIIKEIRDSEGNTISITEPNQSQIVSAETARNLQSMLRQVVLTGTGRRAQLDGYTSAGKTGTAWKFDAKTKRVERSKYMSTFVGFAPVDDPKYVIAVVMDEPTSGARDGGGVSAPIFKVIAQQLLENAGVRHDLTPSGIALENPGPDIPEVTGGDPAEKAPTSNDRSTGKPEEPKTAKTAKSGTNTDTVNQGRVDKTTEVNKLPKPGKAPPAIWKTKLKT
jgi:cell division protein FtsI (penicillin-binding protein 3)